MNIYKKEQLFEMSYITTTEARRFINLPAFDASTAADEDILIQSLIDAAEATISNQLMREWSDIEDASTHLIPNDLKTAILTLTATWYVNRESVAYGTPNKVPYTLEYILQPYKEYDKTKQK